MAGIPEAGQYAPLVTEILPVQDTHQDITLEETVEHFRKNLRGETRSEAKRLAKLLFQLSHRHKMSPGLLLSLIETESHFRTGAVSHKGAIGLMQIRPRTAEYVAKRYRIHAYKDADDLYDPSINMKVGVAYLSYLKRRFGNSVHYLAAYNMGPTALRERLSRGERRLGHGVKDYVKKIQSKTRALRSKSANKTTAMADFSKNYVFRSAMN